MVIVTLLCTVVAAWYAGAIALFFAGLHRLRPAGEANGLSFSVIIAARNEEANIGPCLDTVLDQTLAPGRYEVIVVDDRSTDATAAVVEHYRRTHANLHLVSVTTIPRGAVPKKHAIVQGLACAANSVVVLTDADCRVPRTWLDTVDRYCTPETGLVQGLTSYRPTPGVGAVLFGFQSVDFFSHGVVSAAAIGAGLPLNANANNLAFRRTAFDEVDGYGTESAVVSGDDDLLLQRIDRSGRWRVAFMADRSGAVETFPTTTWRGLLEQRKRWGSVTVHYPGRQTALLAGVFALYVAIASLLVLSFVSLSFLLPGLGLLALKMAGEFSLMVPATRRFGGRRLLGWIIPASLPQLFLVLYAVAFGVFGAFSWKDQGFGRTVKKGA